MFLKKQNQKIFLIAALVGFSPLASAEMFTYDSDGYIVPQIADFPSTEAYAPLPDVKSRYAWQNKVYLDENGKISRIDRQLGDLDEPEGTEFYNQYGMEVPPEHLDEYIDYDY